MLFNSLEFVVFFALVFPAYLFLRHRLLARKVLLLLASYYFYMAWNPPFVLLLMLSTALDYVAGRRISATSSTSARTAWLVISCVGNLGVLAFFKYGDFFMTNVWRVMPRTAEYPSFFEHLVLPIGISFYTFQSMSYTIDVFRSQRDCERNLLDFALYVTFFPQLVAGPILRSREFLPQLKDGRMPTSGDFLTGVDQVIRGFAKKVLLADPLGAYAYSVYFAPEYYGAVNQLIALYALSFRIYLDFSGYSDIAIGTARMMGYRIPINFNLPYLARNPVDFWARWHISLSTWLRDYLYFPLGGNRHGRWKIYRNLFLTMLLGGLWHGAAWGFIIWGTIHGVWIVAHRFLYRDHKFVHIPVLLAIFTSFHIHCFGVIFFGSLSLKHALTSIRQFADFETPIYYVEPHVLALLAVSFISHWLGASTRLKAIWQDTFIGFKAVWYAFVIIAIFLTTDESVSFIYYQF